MRSRLLALLATTALAAYLLLGWAAPCEAPDLLTLECP